MKPFGEWMEEAKYNEPSIIDQLLPENAGEYMLVSGRTGIGKSILVLHQAFCLATGTPFYGFDTRQVIVGYLAMEGGKDNIRDRFVKVIPQYPEVQNGNLLFELTTPMDLEKKYDYFMEIFKGCKVVIIDNLRQVTSGKYTDPNYAARWLKVYQKLLLELGAVGILTHHIKKPTAGLFAPEEMGEVYSLKGGTEYVDGSTTVLLLERKRQGRSSDGKGFGKVNPNRLMLHFAKLRIATRDIEPIELQRNFETCGLDIIEREEIT